MPSCSAGLPPLNSQTKYCANIRNLPVSSFETYLAPVFSVAAPASQPAWRAPTPPASSFSASYPASASAELPLPDISGAWTKDMKRSDLSTYDRALEMMGIRSPPPPFPPSPSPPQPPALSPPSPTNYVGPSCDPTQPRYVH